ncbi:sigma-70 family RNA polymerase sigma factor, partial [Bacillus toyonensis]|uniref:sigma-70 family RNA polymerase sigma factor n=2 Tax=Bacillaceae TaxID=186817 RepID=UPI0030005425
INHCKDYIKSWYNKRVIVTEDDFTYMESQKESVEQTVIQNAEDSRLASAVMNLPIKYREVIYLFYYEELSIKEIATVIEVKENTIKTRLKRAKELLKKGLEE